VTQALRLAFDDCLSKHAAQKLLELAMFSRGRVEIAHLATLNLEGKNDDDWIPELKQLGYMPVTTDRGKKPSRGGKFPILCQRNGLTHIMMSAAVHRHDQFDKIRALLSVWPKLLAASAGAPGLGYLLRKTNDNAFDLSPVAPRHDPQAEGLPNIQRTLPAIDGPEPASP
jgi:hypothetical protein